MVWKEVSTTNFSDAGPVPTTEGPKVRSACESSHFTDQKVQCEGTHDENKCPHSLDLKASAKEEYTCDNTEDEFSQVTKMVSPEKGNAHVAEATGGDDAGYKTSGGYSEEDGELPIDGGWAWMVLAGSFLNIILVVGYGRSVGILFVEYLKIFEASAAKTTLFMGVTTATFSLSSLFSMNLVLQILGVRKTVVLGGAITSLGMLTAVFATSITFLICTHSILIGIGQSMIHGPALVLIGQYFKKRRGLATAVSMSGVSLGGSIFPPIVRYFVDEFGVRGSMLLLTGLTMNIMVGGLLFRPIESFCRRDTCEEHPMNSLKSRKDDNIDPNRPVDGRITIDEDLTNSLLSIDIGDKKKDINSKTHVLNQNALLAVQRQRSYPGSLSNKSLNIYRSNPELTSMSILNIAEESVKNRAESRKTACDYLKMTVVSFDFSLFKYPMFQLIIVTWCFAIIFALVGVYLPALAKEKGIPPTETSFLLTIYSSCDFFSRLTVGYIADLKRIKVHHLISIGLIIAGTLPHFATFYNSFGLMVLCAVSFGLFGSFFNCLLPVIIHTFIGQKHMAKVLGFIAVFHGFAMSVTHPIFGAIRDLTGSYQICFNYIGACNYLAAILLLCEPLFRQRSRKLKMTSYQGEDELDIGQN